jgi:tetratricopeptide (TPR) repeat protein
VLRAPFFHSKRSIAVLPFVDDSKEVSTQYLSDGITEGVIDKLSEIPAVTIMSRSSVFHSRENRLMHKRRAEIIISANLGLLAPRESSPEAKAAATKALVLDPQLGEAHAALGQVKSHYDYDLPGAQTEFTKGIKFNPNYVNGHLFYAGGYFTPMSRHSEAIAEMKKALELDPLSLPLNNLMGNTYMWAGDYGKAVQQFRSTVELDPTFPLTHFFFATCLEGMGRYEEAIAERQKGKLMLGASPGEVEAEAREFRTALPKQRT